MHILWGCLIAGAGLFMLVCGLTRSEFLIYRLMAARSKMLWGETCTGFIRSSASS